MNIQGPDYRYHTLVVTVENKSGVLARVASLFARRAFNIESLAVAPTDDDRFSRITVVVDLESAPLDQIVKQLDKLVNVVEIRELHPGQAAVMSLLLPGWGHWASGRRFKAKLLGITLMLMFILGLALGGFADFDRQRHGYYWIGQMFMGLPAWLSYLPLLPVKMGTVLPYQDTGFTFTSVAGLFNIVVALDAYHRAEADWLRPKQEGAAEQVEEGVA